MKIALLNTLYYPYQIGGAERSVQLLTEGLLKRGNEVIVITLHKPRESPKQEVINGVRIHRVPLRNGYWPFSEEGNRPKIWRRASWQCRDRFNRAMGEAVKEILKQEKPDLLNTHNLVGFSVSAWSAAKTLSLPVIHTLRDLSLVCPLNMFKNGHDCAKQCKICLSYSRVKRKTTETVDLVVGVSRYTLERHLTFGYFPKAHRAVVYNPVILPNTPQSYIKHSGPNLRIGYLGQLAPLKGVQDVICALKNLPAEIHIELVVAGRGQVSYEQTLKKESRGLPVSFLGYVPPERLFQQINLLVVPSRCQEAFPRAILEAFSQGIPVVGSARGGIPEIIEQGRTGWLYNPDIADDLQNTLLEIARDRSQLEQMRPSVLNKVRDFSVANCAKQYEELYHMVTDKGS